MRACSGGIVSGGADGGLKLWSHSLEQLKIYDLTGE